MTTNDPEINISRVRKRVSEGGHDVPEEKILTRHVKAMGLLTDYIDVAGFLMFALSAHRTNIP